MFSVVSSNDEPQHLETLHKWILAEWGEIDQFADVNTGIIIPAPLIALYSSHLLGGLAFTSYPIPEDASLGLWINALIVAPEHRNKGIGSQLIKSAEIEAKKINAKELYAYTSIPTLYKILGWEEINNDGKNSTFRKSLSALNHT
ncbi:MAG: GNAT family N-acetyltransferase [Pseudomonadota bacterium]